jgi:hypothetical protein
MDREEHYKTVELVLSAQGALYHQDVQRANKLLDEAYWALVRQSIAMEADSLAGAFGDEASPPFTAQEST